MAEFLAARFAGQLPMPPDKPVRALHALSDGLVYARAMNPKEFGDDMIVAAFEAFANLPVKKAR